MPFILIEKFNIAMYLSNLLKLIIVFASVASQLYASEKVDIYIRDDVFDDYKTFIGDKNVNEVNSFVGKTVRRDVVDMIITQQALHLGGFKHQFNYIVGKMNFRNTRMLEQGKLLLSFDTYWLSDAKAIKDHIYISPAIIRKGEYVAAIYTSPKNQAVLSINHLNDLTAFSAVSTPKWRTDWQTINNLPLKKVVREDEWLSMARMVDLGWVDIIFMPFHGSNDNDHTFSMEKITLVPVKNVAIEFDDSRHIVISRHHPLAEEAITALEIGIKKLRAKNTITKAYTEAGFFVDRTKINVLNSTH
ncbi:hypothetical protein [Thalassotalea ganghwensis]